MIVLHTKTFPTRILKTLIIPGQNVIESDLAKKMVDDVYFKELLASGTLKIVDETGEAKKDKTVSKKDTEINISGMTGKDAIKSIKKILSIPTLEKLLDIEDRSSVIKAIEKQIEMIEEKEDDE